MKKLIWFFLTILLIFLTGCFHIRGDILGNTTNTTSNTDEVIPDYFILGNSDIFLERSGSCALDSNGNFFHTIFSSLNVIKRNSDFEVIKYFGKDQTLSQGGMGDILIRSDVNELYLADTKTNAVHIYNLNGVFKRSVTITAPMRMIFYNNHFFVAQAAATGVSIKIFNSDFDYLWEYNHNGLNDGEFSDITGFGFDAAGQLWIADTVRYDLQIFNVDYNNETLVFIGKTTTNEFSLGAGIRRISNIRYDSINDLMWACTHATKKCLSFRTDDFSLVDNIAISITVATTCQSPSSNDKMYLAAVGSNIAEFDFSTKSLTSILSGSGSDDGLLSDPENASTDNLGNILVADYLNRRASIFDSQGNFIKTVGASGVEPQGIAGSVSGVIGNGSLIYIASMRAQVHIFDYDGNFQGILGTGTTGVADGELSNAYALAFDDDGNIHVVESNNHRISVFQPDGTFVRKYGSNGVGDGQLQTPRGIAINDGLAYIGDAANTRIVIFDATNGNFVRNITFTVGSGNLQVKSTTSLWNLAVDDDYIYGADSGNVRIFILNKSDGSFVKNINKLSLEALDLEINNGTTFGVALTDDGNILIVDIANDRISKVTFEGTVVEK